MNRKDRKKAFRYFLGELPETEQTALEERFFADEDYSRFLDTAEKDLVDLYAAGKLDVRQRRNFQKRFLTSERRREMLRLSTASLEEKSKKSFLPKVVFNGVFSQRFAKFFTSPRLPLATAAILTIAILSGAFMLFINQTDSSFSNNLAAKNAGEETRISLQAANVFSSPESLLFGEKTPTSKSAEHTAQIEKLKNLYLRRAKVSAQSKETKIAANLKPKTSAPFALLAPSAEEKLVVGARTENENVRLRVAYAAAPEFVSYRVEIHGADGDLIWSREIKTSDKNKQKQSLALNVRGGALVAGNYGLTVSGATGDGQLEEINNYSFTVRGKN